MGIETIRDKKDFEAHLWSEVLTVYKAASQSPAFKMDSVKMCDRESWILRNDIEKSSKA